MRFSSLCLLTAIFVAVTHARDSHIPRSHDGYHASKPPLPPPNTNSTTNINSNSQYSPPIVVFPPVIKPVDRGNKKHYELYPSDYQLSDLDTTNPVISFKNKAYADQCPLQWHSDYSVMHAKAAKILNSVPSEEWDPSLLEKEGLRVFIYIAREGKWENLKSGGVADRFSLVGMFATCLAHNTAFFIDYPGLSDVFSSGAGNLSWSVNATGYIDRLGYKETVLHFPDLYKGTRHCETWKANSFCRDLTLDKHIANNSLTIARTARGKISRTLFKDKFYINIMKSLGFRLESTFGCLFDYLFQPSPLLIRNFHNDMKVLASPDSVKFLLQVRTGDAAISRGTTNSSYFRERVIPYLKSFTDCALAMEAKIAEDSKSSPAPPVVWYLMSDLVAVREYMTSKFGDKILTHNSTIQNLMAESYSRLSFLDVLGEQWCGGLADYFLVSRGSGLGRQAAFRSKRPTNRVVSMEFGKSNRCSVVTDLQTFGTEFSGV